MYLGVQKLALFCIILLCQARFKACHSAPDAESRIIKKSGFLLEFIPHRDAGQE